MIHYIEKAGSDIIRLDQIKDGCWVHVEPPFGPDELQNLAEQFGIPMDFITDSLDMDERSRYELEDGMRLILVNAPFLSTTDRDGEAIYQTAPIGIILTDEHMLTITGQDHPVIKQFFEGRVKNFNPVNRKRFVLQLFERIVLRYLSCLKKLNLKRHHVESELYNSSKSSDLKQLLQIEKSLVYFVNSLTANELLKMKMKRTDFLRLQGDEVLVDLFEDVIIDNSQALEMANVYSKVLNGTMEAYASIISNNMNSFINRLTLVTIILMVPTLIYSFYGMNVQGLPFADSKYAFFYIGLFSLLISVSLVYFLRKRRML